MEIKSLTINGDIYAKYDIKYHILYLKKLIDIIPGDELESENILIKIISHIENENIRGCAYLNI